MQLQLLQGVTHNGGSMNENYVNVFNYEPSILYVTIVVALIISLIYSSIVIKEFKSLHKVGKLLCIFPVMLYIFMYIYRINYYDWLEYGSNIQQTYTQLEEPYGITQHTPWLGHEIYFIFLVCISCSLILKFKKKD